jgi:ATP-binding cassette, subfamily A (ABC1), member 3
MDKDAENMMNEQLEEVEDQGVKNEE